MGLYSKRYGTRVDAIITECQFCTTGGGKNITAHSSLWDTGSTTTILSRRLINELKTEPFNKGGMSGIGGNTEGNTYLLHVMLPTGDAVTYVEVFEADLEDFDAIIGMDIISLGDFHIDSSQGDTLFSFQVNT